MSRLTIDITEQQHQSLKALAALQGKTIKQYTLEHFFPNEDEQACLTLKTLLEPRINNGLTGLVSTKYMADELAEGRA
ncbi:antitoxin [Providencia huaxiensis]|uniref:antitoxin n=1 Tax=Providencia huaxiensis TaxID=2027290 RepID=UPI001EFD355C|nr:antitoxin [Providencia huaxiensis]MCG9537115.1 antitoxin [Providencia huaxiensis]